LIPAICGNYRVTFSDPARALLAHAVGE
jgi:hypothetical protein